MHTSGYSPLRGRQCGSLFYTGFGSLKVASPGVKHYWAAPQPQFFFLTQKIVVDNAGRIPYMQRLVSDGLAATIFHIDLHFAPNK